MAPKRPRTKVLPDEVLWTDARLNDVRHNQYAFEAPEVTDLQAWQQRAAWVRKRTLLSAGLWPMPGRTPLNARAWGEFEHGGCRVAKAQFESRPGLLVTGNLYRPLDAAGPRPGVLCPHGHWGEGRVAEVEAGSVPGRCIMLARLGFVVFSYDMIGYNDSRQVAHRWPLQVLRRAALWGISPFGLQVWNSIRAVDFLSGLADVDAERIGCTGASGGASQTWNLGVVDDRVKVMAPVCMLSSHYQGGCTCEQAPLLRLGPMTTLDVAGALAPRPVLFPSVTGDWTNMNPLFEIPVVRSIYRLYGAEDRVENVHFDDDHNYNQRTAEHVCAFMLRWLAGRKDVGKRVRQPGLTRPPIDKALIFPSTKPGPVEVDSGPMLARLAKEEGARFVKPPTTAAQVRCLRRELVEPFAEALAVSQPEPDDVAVRVTNQRTEHSGYRLLGRSISRRGKGDVIPALWLVPEGAGTRAPAALAVCGRGKASLFRAGRPGPLLSALLSAGRRVLAIDCVGVGDTAVALKRSTRDLTDPLFYAFNPSLLGLRVQDVLTALAAVQHYERPRSVSVVGTGEGARWALLTLHAAKGVRSAAMDLTGVSLDEDGWMGEAYHPLMMRLGGLKTATALACPMPLGLFGSAAPLASWTRAVYRLLGRQPKLTTGRPSPSGMVRCLG